MLMIQQLKMFFIYVFNAHVARVTTTAKKWNYIACDYDFWDEKWTERQLWQLQRILA